MILTKEDIQSTKRGIYKWDWTWKDNNYHKKLQIFGAENFCYSDVIKKII